jgi:P4 family phage/plasmid primase-like protien
MWKRLDDRRFSGVVTQKAMTCSLVYENGEMPGEALVMLPNRLRSLVDVVLARLAEKPAITEAHAIPTESVVITENLERTAPDRWYGNTALFTMTGSNTGDWLEFIASVFPDEQTAAYAQTLIGAAAFGFGNVLQKMLWLVGPPATGKSTFAKVLHHTFGGYSASINIQEISEYDIARIASRRLVIANEADGRYVARIIKQLTSGDTMRAREIYGRPFDVEFNGVIVATSNEYPRPYDVAGMVRRFVFVEFNHKPEKTDEMLPAKLSENTAEVIDWVVDGFETFRRWQRGEVEVAVPESVKRLSTAYERWTDQMKMFIDSKLVYHQGARTPAEEVYEEYRNWCRAIDHQPRAFGYNWLRSLDQNGVPLDDTGAYILDFRLAGV